jgi:hypothetical protein
VWRINKLSLTDESHSLHRPAGVLHEKLKSARPGPKSRESSGSHDDDGSLPAAARSCCSKLPPFQAPSALLPLAVTERTLVGDERGRVFLRQIFLETGKRAALALASSNSLGPLTAPWEIILEHCDDTSLTSPTRTLIWLRCF